MISQDFRPRSLESSKPIGLPAALYSPSNIRAKVKELAESNIPASQMLLLVGMGDLIMESIFGEEEDEEVITLLTELRVRIPFHLQFQKSNRVAEDDLIDVLWICDLEIERQKSEEEKYKAFKN